MCAMKKHFLIGASALAMMSPAFAGDLAASQQAEEAAQAGRAGPEIILVTARRRSEALTGVPTAASVIDGQALLERGGATTAGELLADQPSVRFNNLNSSITSEISMRASSTARATNGDPSVGLFRNGSYIAGGGVGGRNFARLDYLDIGRVEVLRGTQGALYGRNAVGGAVNIISAEPVFENTGYLRANYGFDNESAQLQGAANFALSDTVAFRLSADIVEQDSGFFYNPQNDVYFDQQSGYGLRGQVRWREGNWDVVLLAETQELTTPTIHYQIDIPAGTPGFPGGYTQPVFSYPWNTPPRASQDIDAVQFRVGYDLEGARLSSTTLWRVRNSEYDLDNDAINPEELANAVAAGQISPFVPLDPNTSSFVVDETSLFSQDIHLAGDAMAGRLEWLGGGEFLSYDSSFSVPTTRTPTVADPSPGNIAPAQLDFESAAAYGLLSYDLTERFNITGELRYTRDTRSISARMFDLATGAPLGGAARVIDAEIDADNLSYNFTAAYDLSDTALAYLKIGTSYRAGGFNTRLSDPRAPNPVVVLFDNENSTSYELGFRGTTPGGTYFAVAGYFTQLRDLIAQVDDGCFVGSTVCPVSAVAYLTNAGDAESWGIEAELSRSFDIGRGTGRIALSASRQEGEVTAGPLSGLSLAQVPEWLASASFSLNYPLSDTISFHGNALLSTQSGGRQELTATSVELDDYQLLNLRAGLDIGSYRITAYATNALDQLYFVARAPTINRYNQPRVIGIELGYRW